jgi:hypothetical protein
LTFDFFAFLVVQSLRDRVQQSPVTSVVPGDTNFRDPGANPTTAEFTTTTPALYILSIDWNVFFKSERKYFCLQNALCYSWHFFTTLRPVFLSKVGAYAQSWCLRIKMNWAPLLRRRELAPTREVGAYGFF